MPTNYTRNHNCMVAVIGKLPGELGVILQNRNPKWRELYDEKGELKDLSGNKYENAMMAQKLGAFDLIIGRTVHNRKYKLSFYGNKELCADGNKELCADGNKKLCVDDDKELCADDDKKLHVGNEKPVKKEITGEIGWWVVSKSWLIKNSSVHQSVKNLLKAVNGRREISDALVSCIQNGLVRFLDLKGKDQAHVDDKYIVPERVRNMVTITMADKTSKVFHWWPGFRIRCWQFMGQVSKRHLYKYGASDGVADGTPVDKLPSDNSGVRNGVATPQVPRTINRSDSIRYIKDYPKIPITDGGVNGELLFNKAIYEIPYTSDISRGGFNWKYLWDFPRWTTIVGYLGTKDEFKNMCKEKFKERFGLTGYSKDAIDSLNLHDGGGGHGDHFIKYEAWEMFLAELETEWRKVQIMYYKPKKYKQWYKVKNKSTKLIGAISWDKVVLFPDIDTLQSTETVKSMGQIKDYIVSCKHEMDDIKPYTGAAIPNDKWADIQKRYDTIVLDSKGKKYYKLPIYSSWRFAELLGIG